MPLIPRLAEQGWFDRLTTNGGDTHMPFALSLSKGLHFRIN